MNKMKTLALLVLILLHLLQVCVAPPVTQNKGKEQNENDEIGGLEDYMEYHRYLREVVNALESDPQFRQKLEKANESDIRSGKIAEELEFVSHHVRTRLDEIKRIELNRLRELTEKKRRLQQNIDMEDPSHRHLDHSNPHTFEIDDLKKLIAKTTEDLAEADKKRREEFKQYELQKEYEKQLKLNHTNGAEREKLEKELKEREEKHKKHEKLHEPGHKAQLEEVWQEQDQMQQEFDPKTFFMLHDMDSNGLWDQDEVKALFVKELEKMYAAGEPEDDMRERAEEMERMRESVFKEVDVNKNGFIDYDEFLAQTKRNDFQQDHGWQGLDEKRPYTDQELEEYIRQHQIHMANQIGQGYAAVHAQQAGYPPPYPGQVPPGGYQQVHPGYDSNGVPIHPGAIPQQQFHPGQIPQHPQQLPGHLPDLNTNEINPQQHPNQPPQTYQQQYQQGQGSYQQPSHIQQGNYQPNQPPQPNYHQPQPPQQMNNNYQQQQQMHQQQQQQMHQQQQQQMQQQQQQQMHQQQQQQQLNQQAQQQQFQQQPQPPVQNQQNVPIAGNVAQNPPVQQVNPNVNKQGSPEVNKV